MAIGDWSFSELKYIAKYRDIKLFENKKPLKKHELYNRLDEAGYLPLFDMAPPYTALVINRLAASPRTKTIDIENINVCNLTALSLLRGLASNSASQSDTYIVKFSENTLPFNLFLKVFEVFNKPTMFSMEMKYYQMVTNMYLNNKCRNIIPVVATSDNCGFKSLLDFIVRAKIANPDYALPETKAEVARVVRNLTKLQDNDRPAIDEPVSDVDKYTNPKRMKELESRKFGFMMTPMAESIKDKKLVKGSVQGPQTTFKSYLLLLDKSIKVANDSVDELLFSQFKQYVFQIYTTVLAFSEAGFNHNDLHMNNILMDKYYPGESKLCVYVWKENGDRKRAWTATENIPRIFDYDRSTSVSTPNTAMHKSLERYGQAKDFQFKTDILKFTCGVVGNLKGRTPKHIKYLDWVINSVRNPNINTNSFYNDTIHGQNCWYTTGKKSNLKNITFLNKYIDNPRSILSKMAKDMPSISAKTLTLTHEMKSEFKRSTLNHVKL